MVIFDSIERWLKITWDRYKELEKVPISVRDAFLVQEYLTVTHIQELTKKKETIKVLDLACGTGRIAESIIKASFCKIELTLADLNKNTLDKAKQYLQAYNSINYIPLDAYKLGDDFQNKFDVIICMDFFHHMSDLSSLMKQINIALNPNGILIANAFDKKYYKKFDRIKYGFVKSFKRSFLSMLAKGIYRHVSPNIQEIIREKGWAGIEPLTKIEVNNYLSPYFFDIKFEKSFYLWFSASKSLMCTEATTSQGEAK